MRTQLGFIRKQLGFGRMRVWFIREQLDFMKTQLGFIRKRLSFERTQLGFIRKRLGFVRMRVDFIRKRLCFGSARLNFGNWEKICVRLGDDYTRWWKLGFFAAKMSATTATIATFLFINRYMRKSQQLSATTRNKIGKSSIFGNFRNSFLCLLR